jgi:hypothetical protein
MLRDNLMALIEPMLASAGVYPLALCSRWSKSGASNRLTGAAFAVVFGVAALWGVRTLFWH